MWGTGLSAQSMPGDVCVKRSCTELGNSPEHTTHGEHGGGHPVCLGTCVCVFTDGYASKRRRLDRVVTGRANCCLGSSVCKETSENSAVCSLPVTLPRSVPAHAPQVISFLSLLSFPLIDFQM